jgi:hypothetical protein
MLSCVIATLAMPSCPIAAIGAPLVLELEAIGSATMRERYGAGMILTVAGNLSCLNANVDLLIFQGECQVVDAVQSARRMPASSEGGLEPNVGD